MTALKLSTSSPHTPRKPASPHSPSLKTSHPQIRHHIPKIHSQYRLPYIIHHQKETYHANKTTLMPLTPKSLHSLLQDHLPTSFALPIEPPRMALHTPRIPIPLHERRLLIERVAALGAEEMAFMPLPAAGNHDFALDGRLAAAAARGEELMEVEVAVEA
jgi:hypothetical protein